MEVNIIEREFYYNLLASTQFAFLWEFCDCGVDDEVHIVVTAARVMGSWWCVVMYRRSWTTGSEKSKRPRLCEVKEVDTNDVPQAALKISELDESIKAKYKGKTFFTNGYCLILYSDRSTIKGLPQ